VYVLEVNPRASRTVPFVSKATGVPLAKVAARVMAGVRLAEMDLPDEERELGRFCVKEAVMPFGRFPGSDSVLGPEMKSTGEVMGVAADFPSAYAKANLRSTTLCLTEARRSSRYATETSARSCRWPGICITWASVYSPRTGRRAR